MCVLLISSKAMLFCCCWQPGLRNCRIQLVAAGQRTCVFRASIHRFPLTNNGRAGCVTWPPRLRHVYAHFFLCVEISKALFVVEYWDGYHFIDSRLGNFVLEFHWFRAIISQLKGPMKKNNWNLRPLVSYYWTCKRKNKGTATILTSFNIY